MIKQVESNFSAERVKARIARQGRSFAESITVMVILGSPKRNCAGQGICRVDSTPMRAATLDIRPCQSVAALANSVVNGRFQLHFEKASLCPHAQLRHFGNAGFQVNERALVRIPQWWRADRYIQPGKYAITESEHCYTVCFELGPSKG